MRGIFSLFSPGASWWGFGRSGVHKPTKFCITPHAPCFHWLNRLMRCFSRCNQPFPHYKPYTRCVSTIFRYYLTSLSLKELIQSRKFLFLKLSGHIGINPQCGRNIRMAKGILNDLDIHSSFTHPGRECVSQGVEAKSILFFIVFPSLSESGIPSRFPTPAASDKAQHSQCKGLGKHLSK